MTLLDWAQRQAGVLSPSARGLLEKYIDMQVASTPFIVTVLRSTGSGLMVNSEADFVLGHCLGQAISEFPRFFLDLMDREMTEKESEEFRTILARRLREVRDATSAAG